MGVKQQQLKLRNYCFRITEHLSIHKADFIINCSRKNTSGKSAPLKYTPPENCPSRTFARQENCLLPQKVAPLENYPSPPENCLSQGIFCEFFLISNFYIYGNFRVYVKSFFIQFVFLTINNNFFISIFFFLVRIFLIFREASMTFWGSHSISTHEYNILFFL